uniref:Uncharacterized protein n=1 Tax=Anopheles quadriannulatus TaxID=34691 RepID=A0A182XRF0_ANOQN
MRREYLLSQQHSVFCPCACVYICAVRRRRTKVINECMCAHVACLYARGINQ